MTGAVVSPRDDCWTQWLSVSEETLFLHDGLLRIAELVQLPHDISAASAAASDLQCGDQEIVSFDSTSPVELSEKLRNICGSQNSASARLLEFRLNALKGFWNAIQHVAGEVRKETAAMKEVLSKRPAKKEAESGGSFSTQVSLLLVLPLLQSHSRLDSSLCDVTANLLLKCLRDCMPLSLAKEPGDCLDGLESLLSLWLGETTSEGQAGASLDGSQRRTAAAAMVALACARGSLATFVHTAHLLQSLSDIDSLPVGDVLEKLTEMEWGQGHMTSLLNTHHVVSWGFDDLLYASLSKSNSVIKAPAPTNTNTAVTGTTAAAAAAATSKGAQHLEIGRLMTCDGKFCYISNSCGKGIVKVGIGLHGTLRGYVYARNMELPVGWLACSGDILLHRPQMEFDSEDGFAKLANIIDKCSLQTTMTVDRPAAFLLPPGQHGLTSITVNLLSDGVRFYWIWTNSDKNPKIFMDVFTIDGHKSVAVPVQERMVLQKKDDAGSKVGLESVVSRLRVFQPGGIPVTPMAALSPNSDSQTGKKEDASGSSVGLTLKSLVKTPMFCDGNALVMLFNSQGGSLANTARSLFGSSANVNNSRVLAVNNCFSVTDGQYVTRSDLFDAPNSAISKMSSISGVGVCFDATNNLICCSTNDFVDQFLNPGRQAKHLVLRHLGFGASAQSRKKPLLSQQTILSSSEVVRHLLQHIGCVCLHELCGCSNSSLSGLSFICLSTDALGCSKTLHLCNLSFVCDILEGAIAACDELILTSCLILVEYLFQLTENQKESLFSAEIIVRLRMLIWRAFGIYRDAVDCGSDCDTRSPLRQICQTVTSGFCLLYPTDEDKRQLLERVIIGGEMKNPAFVQMRQLLLVDFANQLRNPLISSDALKQLWLRDELLDSVLTESVNESLHVVRLAKTHDRQQLERILATVPVASPCLGYLLALEVSVLKQLIMIEDRESIHKQPEYQDEAVHCDVQSNYSLHELRSLLLDLVSKIFAASIEVFKVLVETCEYIIGFGVPDLEFWMQGLERLTKSTLLGHLLPLLVTAMTEKCLQCLMFAENLMSKIVQLVILSSQSALLLRTPISPLSSSKDFPDIDANSQDDFSSFSLNEEEKGFFVGLRIPSAWTSGKSIESVHPVRDNYKFRETVHIPGAKCLYLRFDSRCATQYDYDKLVLFAGPNTSSRKVGEYGGNTFGFGSRSVLGSGWPKDLIKVEGDTVTFSFEMRSGREHNTPDKALWGFLVTVKAHESCEEASGVLPFVADLALGLSVLSCAMLHLLFKGPEFIPEEEASQLLLSSKLLQKCIWCQDELERLLMSFGSVDASLGPACVDSPGRKHLPRIKLPCEIALRLRNLSEKHQPQVRPSISEVIKPDVLEELVLSATIHHLSLGNVVQNITFHEQNMTDEFVTLKEIMSEVYKRLYALIRQLQSIAETEQKWNSEVDEVKQGIQQINRVFFADYHLVENKVKELIVLCFLKDINFDRTKLEDVVSDLCDKMSSDVERVRDENVDVKNLPRTKAVVSGITERLHLLLQVTIMPEMATGITRSTSSIVDAPRIVSNVMVRSDTDVLKSGVQHQRSCPAAVDASADDSILDIFTSKRPRHSMKKDRGAPMHRSASEEDDREKPTHVLLIDQLFSFIGSNPEKAVSCQSFLSVAHLRWKRGSTRTQALKYMRELLTAANQIGSATHLVAAVTAVLQHGPRVDELHCGGKVTDVREAFAETMVSVVQLAAKYPIACCNSICLLCIIPYMRAEERCLVRSGLVHLLNKLCSLTNSRRRDSSSSEYQSIHQRVAAMAWAGFQVLSNRCVVWESDDGLSVDEVEHSGLARQISSLLLNHLSQATGGKGNEAASNEVLQEVLNLLNSLSRSKMGHAILSQPTCVSKLLSLLHDQWPSPKLVLIILQLCRVSLPLMSADESEKVELPSWGQDLVPSDHRSDKLVCIVSLLLAKLGDFLVPSSQTTISSHRESMDRKVGAHPLRTKQQHHDPDIVDGRLSVFIHKREEQSSHEVIQPLLSPETQLLRLTGGSNMEKVVRMDREMTKTGKAEVTTEDAASSIRKATKLAQMGLIVSTGPPADGTSTVDGSTSDKRKMASEVICREKNVDLAKTDTVRPFISSHVSNSMAAEVIALLNGLLVAAETQAADTWTVAVDKVISQTLSSLPELLSSLEDVASSQCNREQLMCLAKQINATLAAIGGFKEMIRPGCSVEIIGDGSFSDSAIVSSLSEQTGLATVLLHPPSSEHFMPTRFSDSVQVPISRLKPPANKRLPLHKMSVTESIVRAIKVLLTPTGGPTSSPLFQQLTVYGTDAGCHANQICRVVAEIKTRACKVLSFYLSETSFASAFIQDSSTCIENLKLLANECSSGERCVTTEIKCEKLRMLYIDCAKPPPPPNKAVVKQVNEFGWNPSAAYPPVRSCVFSSGFTDVMFVGDPSSPNNLPRGTLIFTTQPIPHQAPSFYWEVEICPFGDSLDDSASFFSFGFMPNVEKKDGTWAYPVGSCLLHNNGRAVHYNGSSLLQWRSVRLDITLGVNDVAGIGWERHGDSPPAQNQIAKGLVYFTFNGQRLGSTIEEVSGSMWPVVHIQRKNMRIRANFGGSPFAYAEGHNRHSSAESAHDLVREIRDTFIALPFHISSDSDSEGPVAAVSATTSDAATTPRTPPGPPCRTSVIPKSLKEYNADVSSHYKLPLSYGFMTQTGPDSLTQQANIDDESDLDEKEDSEPMEDNYTLLVKAWEQKVFPIIRRRFRNEAERKDGLEQIKGALQLGMTDIARQTVEFLYEENGGMPRDLHLPTIEDIKDELARFTIDRLHKGTIVVIKNVSQMSMTGTIILPKYAVRSMLRTFGLMGVVLDVDQPNELVEVETYLRSDGILVRYWYPLDMLERPAPGYRKSSFIIGRHKVLDTSNISIHKELLATEGLLSRMFCRCALLELITQCNSPAMSVCCSQSLGSAAASAILLQQLDVENLRLLSNELLAPPESHGLLLTSALQTGHSVKRICSLCSMSLAGIFYDDVSKLKEELRVAIVRAANEGEDYILELTNQICLCLQTAPEMFPCEEFPVSETKICTDVHFPSMAFLVVSCRADPKAVKKDTSMYKSPWGRVFVYRGHRIKKSGALSKQEVVCYPRDVGGSSTDVSRFSSVIIPADFIHVRVGISPPPGMILTIHGIPSQLLLAITYIETLISCQFKFQFTKVDYESAGGILLEQEEDFSEKSNLREKIQKDVTLIPCSVLLRVVELLTCYLSRADVPAAVKEIIFHLFAQTLRMIYQCEVSVSGIVPNLSLLLSGSKALFTQLQVEVCRLYEEETRSHQTDKTSVVRYSLYLQSLIELCLAITEVTAPILTLHSGSADSVCSPSASFDMLSPDSKSAMVGTLSGSPAKRKKVKVKRERGSSTPKRGSSPRRLTEVDSPLSLSPPQTSTSAGALVPSPSVNPSALCLSPGSKPEEQLWFHRALTMSQILCYLVRGDPIGNSVTMDAVADASGLLSSSTSHSRLLVISNIPHEMHASDVRRAFCKAVVSSGGHLMEDLYLPVTMETLRESKWSSSRDHDPTAGEKSMVDSPDTDNKSNTCVEKLVGYAVLQLRCKSRLESVQKALAKCRVSMVSTLLAPHDVTDLPEDVLSISTVNPMLFATDNGNAALENYLLDKIVMNRTTFDLCDSAVIALTEIFHSCFIVLEQRLSVVSDEKYDSGYIYLTCDQMTMPSAANLMFSFFVATRPAKKSLQEHVWQVLLRYGVKKIFDKDEAEKKSSSKAVRKPGIRTSKEKTVATTGISIKSNVAEKKTKARETQEKQQRLSSSPRTLPRLSTSGERDQLQRAEEHMLTLDRFLSFVADKVREDVRCVWRALFACGFDLQFSRCACIDRSQAQQMSLQWTLEMDGTLVMFINHLCRRLSLSPFALHPHEVYVEETDANSRYILLREIPVESIRLRFALIQSLNETLSVFFLPLIDLRPSLCQLLPHSIASLVADARHLIFYHAKMEFMNQVLNSTALRRPDQPAPEIVLNPLDNIQLLSEPKPPMDSYVCQALKQLSTVSSSLLCVALAKGGDPTYAFNVRFIGEEVHGTSGSFRHFLWHVAKELEYGQLDILVPSPSALGYKNCGKYLLSSDNLTFSEEKIYQFFGQLLGVAIRAGIPFGLDLASVFWKNLVGLNLDPVVDLQESDIITYAYIKKIEIAENLEELIGVCSNEFPFFVYQSIEGDEIELIENGRKIQVSWENRQQYVDCIRDLRLRELRATERMRAIKTGLASVVPLQLFALMTPFDAEFKTCGLPEVNLEFLKMHTIYQVGLTETDPHIQFFWTVLENFSPEEICRFIKFACNQERLPQICPCQTLGPDAAHVPPYPMKIAPPDNIGGNPDSWYIRTETCMFMVKLPQYSTQELMRERLLCSIHYRDDPLSG